MIDGDGKDLSEVRQAESELMGVGREDIFQGPGYTAPGEQASQPLGVVFQGSWRVGADGFARHTRETVKALAKVGVPIHLQAMHIGQGFVNEELPEEVRALEYLTRTSFERNIICIKQVIWTGYEMLLSLIRPRSLLHCPPQVVDSVLSRTIVYTVWERDRVNKDEVDLLNRLGQVWVTNQDTFKAFARSGVDADKLRVVPYCYEPDDVLADPDPENPGKSIYSKGPSWISHPRAATSAVPAGKRFYHIGKWESRKDHHRMIGSFLKAFRPTDDSSLLVKTSKFASGGGYLTPDESVAYWLEDPTVQRNGWTTETFNKRVRIVQKKISEQDIQEIHRRNNIYLSIGHCEGWDIPAFEAKLAGNRLVYTDYGGPPEYATPDDIALPWKFVRVDAAYKWGDARWAHVDAAKIVDALRSVKPPEKRVQSPSLYSKFGRIAVGLRMRGYIQELLDVVEPGVKLEGSVG